MRDEAIGQLEGFLGRKVTYQSISPSILRFLSISDLTIHGTGDKPADLLSVDRLRVYYRPIQLLRRNYADAFTEVRIENTTLTIDASRDADLAALFTTVIRERQAELAATRGEDVATVTIADVLPETIVIGGQNISLSLRSAFGLVEMDNLAFATELIEGSIAVELSGDAQLAETQPDFPFRNVVGRVEATGTVSAATGDAVLQVALPTLSSDLATIRRQVLQVRFQDGSFEARNVQNRDPIDIYVRYTPEAEELYARFLADGYELSRLVELHGDLEPINEFLELPVSGQANATVTPDSFNYGGSILGSIPEYLALPAGEITVQFEGDAQEVTFDTLSLVTDEGEVAYNGRVGLFPLRPNGTIAVTNLVYGGIRPLTVRGELTSNGDQIALSTNRFRYGGTLVDGISGSYLFGIAPEASVSLEIAGRSSVEVSSTLAADGSIETAQIDARSIDPDELVQIQQSLLPGLELPDLSFLPEATTIDTRVSVDMRDGLSIFVPLLYAYQAGDSDNYVELSLDYEDGVVAINDIEATYDGYSGTADLAATIARDGTISFSTDLSVEGIPYAFSGTFDPGNTLTIEGLYDVAGRLFFGERDELVFEASGDIPLPIGQENDSHLAFEGDGYFFSLEDWAVNLDRLAAVGVPIATIPSAEVSLAGRLDPSGARVSELSYSDAFSSVQGSADVTWSLDEQSGAASFVLSGAQSGERYEGTISLAADSVGATVQAALVPLARLGQTGIEGYVSGTVEVAGPQGALTTRVAAELEQSRFNGDPLSLSAEIALLPDRIEIANGMAEFVRVGGRDVSGYIDLLTGEINATGVYSQLLGERSREIDVDVQGGFGGPIAVEELATRDFQTDILLAGIPVQEGLPGDWPFRFERTGDTFRALGGPEEAMAIELKSDGAISMSTRAPLPLTFTGVGVIGDGELEADFFDVQGDIGRLWGILDSRGFGLTGGQASGSLRIVGPLNDPDFYGTLVAEGITAEIDILGDPVGPARTFVVFDEKQMTVRETEIAATEGRARVEMTALFSRWIPDIYEIRVETVEDDPIRIANQFGDIEVDGYGAGTLLVQGEAGSISITGDLVASPMSITLADQEEIEQDDGPASELTVDLNVTTDRGVEFLWPTRAFPILRGSADVNESVRITYEEDPRSFSVDGEVDIQSGEVFYFDRSFYIREGEITFAEDETGFDPQLSVNAEIREIGEDGPVRIYLVADERPLSEFSPQWRSDPPLSEAAILTLLGGTVFVSEEGDPIDLSQAVLLTSDVVTQYGIIRGFESTVRETLQLDLFSVRTQLFQNLLRGVIDQDAALPLDTQTPSLGQYLDNTTLFMGKYLGTDLFLELLVQLRASDQTEGSTQSLTGIEVESELGLELQTPFFQLEWSFFPRDPSTLFLSDNTISFSWEYSY